MSNKKIVNGEHVAAIDLGTNSCRVLVADVNGKDVFRDVRHVALGEGLAESGLFCDVAIKRAVNAFTDFSKVLKKYNVTKYRAIATAACRMSSNTEDFLAKVKENSKLDVDVISEYEEARLTLKGAKLNAPKDKKYLFVYDLGGGSTEITLATNEDNPKILATISIPLGARNATEIFNLEDYNHMGATRLIDDVKRFMKKFKKQIEGIDYKGNTALVATSSTPLRLTAWLTNMDTYDKFRADGLTVTTEALDDLIANVLLMDYKKRLHSVYIGKCRAKIFVAALIIFRTIYQELGATELTASLKSAQEAIVAELVGK